MVLGASQGSGLSLPGSVPWFPVSLCEKRDGLLVLDTHTAEMQFSDEEKELGMVGASRGRSVERDVAVNRSQCQANEQGLTRKHKLMSKA